MSLQTKSLGQKQRRQPEMLRVLRNFPLQPLLYANYIFQFEKKNRYSICRIKAIRGSRMDDATSGHASFFLYII